MARAAEGAVTLVDLADGTDGSRGAGRWNIDVDSVDYVSSTLTGALPNSTSDAQEAWEEGVFIGESPGDPVLGDQAWFYKGTAQNPTDQSVWIYSVANNTNVWLEQNEVIHGNLLVEGTVTLDRLQVSNFANEGAVAINDHGMAIFAGSETIPRIIVGDLSETYSRT